MSIVDEPMFVGNVVSGLLPSRYVDSPRICVELLSHYWSQPRKQQDQQRPKYELREPELVACRGRWWARSHEFLLVRRSLRAQRLSYRPGLPTVHAGAQGDNERGRSQLTWQDTKEHSRWRHTHTEILWGYKRIIKIMHTLADIRESLHHEVKTPVPNLWICSPIRKLISLTENDKQSG